ncbi:MAG: aldo/keto reductase [candidate division Zixibacteria bacterium]|nr:aldo/keto reductase [candidate division Zixibacteria bacterium]
MQYGRIQGLDKPVSRLVQGTIMLTARDMDYSFDLLDRVFEAGINTFDTGHIYGNGDGERVLGRWIRERGVRDRVVILSKGCHHNQDRERVTPYDIGADLHDSLARFQVDSVDLYVLHRDDPSKPVGPIMETLNGYIIEGKIGVIGGSNWSHLRIEEANQYAAQQGLSPFTVSSPNFSLADQAEPPWANCISVSGPAGAEARAWYLRNRMPLFTWSSLANGFFSGRLTRGNFESVKDQLDASTIRSYCTEDNFRRLDRVEQLALEKGLAVPQVALAYVLCQSVEIFALVGAHSGEEVAANAQALDLLLTSTEQEWLDLKRENR